METLYVGGKHFFNRFSNLEAAVERAQADDVIELHKDVKDVCISILKNITINGNGHLITPAPGKTAFDCGMYVTLNDMRFDCQPRTNAVVMRAGGVMKKIMTRIIGPARAVYPTVVHRGGTLTVEDSNIMGMETYNGHSRYQTVTFFKNSHLLDYYDGKAWINDNNYTMSTFRGRTSMIGSVITRALFEGETSLSDVMLKNFNKATGHIIMNSCTLMPSKYENVSFPGEPVDGPLKDWNPDVIPFALHIAGGRVVAKNFSSGSTRDTIGFYMTNGSLDIRSTVATNDQARHLIKGGAVVFNDVTDDGYYEIRKARYGIIRSRVNMSAQAHTAMEELNNMIGLASVKKQVRTIMNTIQVNMANPEKDFGFSHHMVFAGDPGTGKTTVAKLVAQALFEIGAIPENKCMEVPASQLVKGYVGQTGAHVEEVLKKALGGVLFIDEAYELMVRDGQNTFNNDAIAVLLRYMEDHRGSLVVIAAGYEKEMREFLASNVGLTRRFQWVAFEDYTPDEMAEIFISMAGKYKEGFAFRDARHILADCFARLTAFYLSHPDAKGRVTNGGNGGLVRNLFQQVVFMRNNRIAEDPKSTMTFIKSDIQQGFEEEMEKAVNVQPFL